LWKDIGANSHFLLDLILLSQEWIWGFVLQTYGVLWFTERRKMIRQKRLQHILLSYKEVGFTLDWENARWLNQWVLQSPNFSPETWTVSPVRHTWKHLISLVLRKTISGHQVRKHCISLNVTGKLIKVGEIL
jgi:hypothetical protein